MSFVEVLVAIVLLGTVVVGVLAALQTTILATSVSRDHAKAHQWLQSAVGVIQGHPFADCTTVAVDGSSIRDEYQAEVDLKAPAPFGFSGGTIVVSIPEVWDGSSYVAFDTQSACVDDNRLRQQLVTITVTAPDLELTENVQVVKRGG